MLPPGKSGGEGQKGCDQAGKKGRESESGSREQSAREAGTPLRRRDRQYLPAAEVEKKVAAKLAALKEKEKQEKEAQRKKEAAAAKAAAAKAAGEAVDEEDEKEAEAEEDDKPKSSPTPDTNPLRGYRAPSTGIGRWFSGELSMEEEAPPLSWEDLFAWVRRQGERTMPASAKYMDADVLDFLRSAGSALGMAVDKLTKQDCIREVLEKATILYTSDVYAKACAVFMRTFPRIRNVDVWQFSSLRQERTDDDVFNEDKAGEVKEKFVVSYSLRSILDEETDELDPVDAVTINTMDGELGWPKAALGELEAAWHKNCGNGRSKPFV